MSAPCIGVISVYFTDGETEAGEPRGVGDKVSPPSSRGHSGVTGASVGNLLPGPTLSSQEGEAALLAAVGERALTQHADHLGVLQHGGPAGSLHRHPHVPRVPKPRRHRVLQGQAGLQAQAGLRTGPESWPHRSLLRAPGGRGEVPPERHLDLRAPQHRHASPRASCPPEAPRPPVWMVSKAQLLGWASLTFLPQPKLSWAVVPSCSDPRAWLSTHPMGWGTHVDRGVRTMTLGLADGETEAQGGTVTLQELSWRWLTCRSNPEPEHLPHPTPCSRTTVLSPEPRPGWALGRCLGGLQGCHLLNEQRIPFGSWGPSPQAKGQPCPQRSSGPPTRHLSSVPHGSQDTTHNLGDASEVGLSPGTPSSMKPSLITSTLKLEMICPLPLTLVTP